ncbi:ChaN family lipoprotein [Limisalsivibrio acetivorans]|uniref:ChaN family lipoprotein n=1 Tax=Limisalsivibrio acetivorans TaxID=1304888 RepID=UPI0003B6023C|nr:ChaN family lipoprotein [Limisalsivibrio acetivorans]
MRYIIILLMFVSATAFGADPELLKAFGHNEKAKKAMAEYFDTLNEKSIDAGGVRISVLFSDSNMEHADKYLEASAEYIELYSKLLTPYPYEEFKVVEVPYPAGYAFDGYTMIGKQLIPYPFILDYSLGHEVLHQWFGGAVGIDYETGNWAEGLVTLLSDHLYRESSGEDKEYRRMTLAGFDSYVRSEDEISLREFRARHGKKTSSVGYGKSMMFLHMLRNMLGEQSFYDGLRLFIRENTGNEASWDDLIHALERSSARELKLVAGRWLEVKGMPELSLHGAKVGMVPEGFETKLRLTRGGAQLPIHLPVSIRTVNGIEERSVYLDSDNATYSFITEEEPVELAVDPSFDAPRILLPAETPPTTARFMGADSRIIVTGDADKYAALIELFDGKVIQPDELTDEMFRQNTILFAGVSAKEYLGERGRIEAGFVFNVYPHPFMEKGVVAHASAMSAEEVERAAGKLRHYGRYAGLAFNMGENILKRVETAENGIIEELRREKQGVKVESVLSVSDIARTMKDAPFVFIGEKHDEFSHHANQLIMIKALHDRKGDIAIGMEMFHREFQDVLDDYIAGRIDERTMLERTEYFSRWRFDFNLYKPILDYAKENSIPVIALNISNAITAKVSRNGLESLTDEEREQLPREIDYSNSDHRDFLEHIFSIHKESRNFEYFLQAQLLWEETMAETAADYYQATGRDMVILAGNGHVRYGYGIPDRLKRRTGGDYVTILNDAPMNEGVADYILQPQPLDGEKAPKIGVSILTAEGVEVIKVFDDTPAIRGGVEKGDVIVGIDGQDVEELEDLKLALFYMEKGMDITLDVLRDGERLTLELTL